MAKIYNFHIYSHETKNEEINDFHHHKVRISNELGSGVASELENAFREDSIAIANEITPPGEKGAGGGDAPIFPLASFFWVGLSVFVVLSKGFFEEFGKGLARKLLSALFNRKKSTELVLARGNKYITIIVPQKTRISLLPYLEKELKKLRREGKYIFNEIDKKLIKIE